MAGNNNERGDKMNTSILLNLFTVSVMEFTTTAETALELIADVAKRYTVRSMRREPAGHGLVNVRIEVIGMIVK